MGIQYRIQVWLMVWIYVIGITAKACICFPLTSAYDEVNSCKPHLDTGHISISPIFGCIPCSQMSLLSSLLEKHASHHNSDFQYLLAQEFSKQSSCDKLLYNASNAFSLTALKRHIVGEGSHRSLVSSLRFDIYSDGMSLLDAYFCESVLVESLPRGVFADSFELQHLVHRGVLCDAALFGDTNLELPSALSNQSMLMLHLDIKHASLSELQEGLQITTELPLHARYPPLEASGYSRVEINPPDVIMLCKPKVSQNECLSVIISWNASTRSAQKVLWKVPSGNQALSGIVSAVTFISSLLSALVIVYTAAFCSLPNRDATD